MNQQASILVAHGEAGKARRLIRLLEELGYVPAGQATDTGQLLAAVAQSRPDLVLLHPRLPGQPDVIAAAVQLGQQHQTPVVFVAEGADEAELARARLADPYGCVFRPEDAHELRVAVEIALARRHAQHRLGLCEHRWLATLRSIGDGVIVTDGAGAVTFLNPVAEQMTGWLEAEACGRPLGEVFIIRNEETSLPVENPVERVRREGVIVGLANHTLLVRRDGWEIAIDDCAAPIWDEHGGLAGVVLVFHDVTERRQQEREIRRLNRLYATLSALNQAVLRLHSRAELFAQTCAICAEQGGFALAWIAWLDADAKQLKPVAWAGAEAAVFEGLAVDLSAKGDHWADSLLCAAFRSGQPMTSATFPEPAWATLAARVHFKAAGAFPLRNGGRVAGLLVVHTNEHEFFRMKETHLLEQAAEDLSYGLDFLDEQARRRAAEAAHAASEARLQAILDQSASLIYVKDLEGRLTHVNRAVCRAVGRPREEIIGRSSHDLLPKPIADAHRANDLRVMATRAPVTEEEVNDEADGQHTYLTVKFPLFTPEGELYGVCGISSDITERKRLEAERLELLARVQHQQRLEAVGTLAAGVAHEINNPINAVMNYAELLRGELPPEQGRWREQATQIIREAERVAVIVRNLLQFARQERAPHSAVEVEELVDGTLSLIRTIIKRDQIRLEVDLPRGLPRVRCRSQQIQQVLMNLLVNGRDALNAKYAGWHEDKVLRVSGGVVEEGGVRWVRVSVEDHGTGIEPEVRRRMFDPFFTTKDRALGSGLGLSVSLGIVREHGGRLEVETEPGRYTRMHLDLPVESEGEESKAVGGGA